MITVACVLWGDWCAPHGENYVRAMREVVASNMSQPHRFVCLSDRVIDGIEVLPLPTVNWPRHLPKMWLYAPDNGLEGRVLVFDLDDIPVGSLDDLAARKDRFVCIEDPWESGAGGGTALFTAGDPLLSERLYQPCVDDMASTMKLCRGFDRYLFRERLPEASFWPGEWVVDAKPQDTREIVSNIPPGTRLAHFHGSPRPHETDRQWLRPWLDSFNRSYS